MDLSTLTNYDIPWTPFGDEEFNVTQDPEEMLLELDALNAAANVVEGRTSANGVRDFIRSVLNKRSTSPDIENILVTSAMTRVAGLAVSPVSSMLQPTNWAKRVAQTVAIAWIGWASGQVNTTETLLKKLRNEQRTEEYVQESSGAVNLMSLYFWAGAVEALAQEDLSTSKRLWKRSLEVGSTFGTSSSLLVQWSYTASFFPMLAP
jgi:hypothetical protein